MRNTWLMTRCGLSAKWVSRLKFFRGWPSLYILMTLCCWQSKNINFHLLMFKFWYKARWKNPEYQLDINSICTYITDINFLKLQDQWSSVLSIVDHFAEKQDTFTAAAGPGHWNDPDMVRILCTVMLRQGRGRGGSKVTVEVKRLT